MRTVSKNVYSFEDLSDKAKEKAREWWREHALDDQWYDAVYEDATEIAKILGITFKERSYQTIGGGTMWEPCIWFSGFASQGDGACFEGTYEYSRRSTKLIREHAPEDKELHRIADGLYEIQRHRRFGITATITHSGRDNHSGCTNIETDAWRDSETVDSLELLLRGFMDWIYDQLRKEADYLLGDEAVDEAIAGYEFNRDGSQYKDV